MQFATFLVLLAAAASANPGIPVEIAAESGTFTYTDDFTTPKCFQDAVQITADPAQWRPGALTSMGPLRNRTVIYRFASDAPLVSAQVRVEQRANARHLGGVNRLDLSVNGLDWETVATSRDLEPDANYWQSGELAAAGEKAAPFTGGRDFWVRIVMDNYSGLETNVSNEIGRIEVELTPKAEVEDAPPLPQPEARQLWNALGETSEWRTLVQDWTEPAGPMPPVYVESGDGWLRPATPSDCGLAISRIYRDGVPPALSAAMYIEAAEDMDRAAAKLSLLAGADTHRDLRVLWDGAEVARFDPASFFTARKDLYIALPAVGPGVHELRITGNDSGKRALLHSFMMRGKSLRGWAEKPPLPDAVPLEVVSAYYMPDPPPPPASQAVEGRQKKRKGLNFSFMQSFYERHAEFGGVRVVLRNPGPNPVRIEGLHLNGKPVEAHYVDFETSEWDAPGVVWYRIRPRTVMPGTTAQMYVRFRRRLAGDSLAVKIACANAPAVETRVHYEAPPAAIDYAVAAPSQPGGPLDRLYLYARRAPGKAAPVRIGAATLDGVELGNARLYGEDFPGNVALAVTSLDTPLVEGDYHTAGFRLAGGAQVSAQFRVLPFFLPRSSIHVPPGIAKETRMNLLTWRKRPLEVCEEYGLPTSCMHGDVLNMHERVAVIFAPDEPDAKDNRGGGYERGLGWHARRLQEGHWQPLVERHTPPVASWMNMNGTIRPLNWGVYGQFGDVNGFDPYPVTYYAADHAYVRESLGYCRLAAAPTPLYAILEAYGWAGKGQGVPAGARGPTVEEYRQNLVQAVGAGAKGFSSWVYVAMAAGWQGREGFTAELATTNRMLEDLEEHLLVGTPIDAVRTDAGLADTGVAGQEVWPKERVWAGALLCGPRTLVIALANHIPASKPEVPAVEPARDVTVTVELPPYMRRGSELHLLQATPNGQRLVSEPVPAPVVEFQVAEITSGELMVLKVAD